MLISIIIPNYNHAKYLVKRLDTVLNQTYANFEVIILDDCSPDNSREILQKYQKHPKVSNVVFNDKNSGSTFKQWNKGISLAKGEWIWLAESDDMADVNFLSTLVPVIEQDQEVGLVYSQSFRMDDRDEVTGNWLDWTMDLDRSAFLTDFKMYGPEYIEKFLIHKNSIPNASAVIFSKCLYYLVGGADGEIRNCGDWELWLKMLLVSKVAYIARPLNYFRYHNQSVIAKANNNISSKIYKESHDRTMRLKFGDHLQARHQGTAFSKKISKQNNDYILEDYINEGIFHFLNFNCLRGWKHIKKVFFAFPMPKGIRIIMEGLRRQGVIRLKYSR